MRLLWEISHLLLRLAVAVSLQVSGLAAVIAGAGVCFFRFASTCAATTSSPTAPLSSLIGCASAPALRHGAGRRHALGRAWRA